MRSLRNTELSSEPNAQKALNEDFMQLKCQLVSLPSCISSLIGEAPTYYRPGTHVSHPEHSRPETSQEEQMDAPISKMDLWDPCSLKENATPS